jgi:uncharacterized metal-binding protein
MRDAIQGQVISVVDNVACSAAEIVSALEAGALQRGFGLELDSRRVPEVDALATACSPNRPIDCLACADRVCLLGEPCPIWPERNEPLLSGTTLRMLDAATDVALESERRLCRLSELVYFSLEMGFETIGVAFCVDLLEPAAILTGVLRRFFEVVPVCCKIGGHSVSELEVPAQGGGSSSSESAVACSPMAQAAALADAGTDLNVAVGLCVGADCVFGQASEAPVTTLFVKDKSLANNPIGAVYSEYYLRESVTASEATLSSTPPSRRINKEAS